MGFRPLSTQALCTLELHNPNPIDTSWLKCNYYIIYGERGSQLYEQIRNRKRKNPGRFVFARIFDFRSYVDATMSLYSIIFYGMVIVQP